jgi:hypothetical protein
MDGELICDLRFAIYANALLLAKIVKPINLLLSFK